MEFHATLRFGECCWMMKCFHSLIYAIKSCYIFSEAAPIAPMWTTEGDAPMPLSSVSMDAKTTPFERRFNPYDFNGG